MEANKPYMKHIHENQIYRMYLAYMTYRISKEKQLVAMLDIQLFSYSWLLLGPLRLGWTTVNNSSRDDCQDLQSRLMWCVKTIQVMEFIPRNDEFCQTKKL